MGEPEPGQLSSAISPGMVVGEYEVGRLLGEGGFGAVYAGTHPVIGKHVAIKVLTLRYSVDREMVSRFIAEARAVNQIRHQHIIDIFSFGKLPDGRQYYVMELLEGTTLDRYLAERKRLTVVEALQILQPIALALDAAHAAGIAHRDLKPENVFIANDAQGGPFPKLLDFGLAKLLGPELEADHSTQTGAMMGTPHYMSPEQCRGKRVDHRTDLYALGVMTFHLLTGELPFTGVDRMVIIFKQLTDAPRKPSEIVAELAAIDEPVLAMLAKDPEDRPDSAVEAINAIATAIGAAPIRAVARPVAKTPPRDAERGIPTRPLRVGNAPTPADAPTELPTSETASLPAGDVIPKPAPATRRSGRRQIVAVAAVVIAFAIGGLVVWRLVGGKTERVVDPDSAEGRFNLAQERFQAKDYRGAAAAFEEAAQFTTKPEVREHSLYNAAQAYRAAEDCAKAGTIYRRYLTTRDQDTREPPLAGLERAEITGRIAEADACERKAMPVPSAENVPAENSKIQIAQATFDQAQLDFLQGHFELAAPAFEAAYAARPYPLFLYVAGAAYHMLAKKQNDVALYERAVDLYRRSNDRNPDPLDKAALDATIAVLDAEIERLGKVTPEMAPRMGIGAAVMQLGDVKVRGAVVVESSPSNATIYLDSKLNGPFARTPWTGVLRGERKIIIELRGYHSSESTISADPSKLFVLRATMSEDPSAGWLSCNANVENAVLYLDDEKSGVVAKVPASLNVTSGVHHLVVKAADGAYDHYTQTLDVTAGKSYTVSAVLRRRPTP